MSSRNKILLLSLFAVSVGLRISKVLPNFEFVTSALIISSLYFSKKQSLSLMLAILAASDLLLGNTNIFLFTWSGFLLPIFLNNKFKNSLATDNWQLVTLKGTGLGFLSNVFFYAWTNLGVWLLDSWGMYPKTLAGLVSCYINGLPFLKTQVESTLLLLPLSLAVCRLLFLASHKTAARVLPQAI